MHYNVILIVKCYHYLFRNLFVHSFVCIFYIKFIFLAFVCSFSFVCFCIFSFIHSFFYSFVYSIILSFVCAFLLSCVSFLSFFHSFFLSVSPLCRPSLPTSVAPIRSHTSAFVLVLSLQPQTDTEVCERLVSSGVNTVFHPSICQLVRLQIRGEGVWAFDSGQNNPSHKKTGRNRADKAIFYSFVRDFFERFGIRLWIVNIFWVYLNF